MFWRYYKCLEALGGLVSQLRNVGRGAPMACDGGLLGILTGLTKSRDHPGGVCSRYRSYSPKLRILRLYVGRDHGMSLLESLYRIHFPLAYQKH